MNQTFTIVLHYGGYVKDGSYRGGFRTRVRKFDSDYISYFEMLNLILKDAPDLRNKKIVDVLYCSPKEEFGVGVRFLLNDADAIDLAAVGLENGSVNVYVIIEDDSPEVLENALMIDYPSATLKQRKCFKSCAPTSPHLAGSERRMKKLQSLQIDEEKAMRIAQTRKGKSIVGPQIDEIDSTRVTRRDYESTRAAQKGKQKVIEDSRISDDDADFEEEEDKGESAEDMCFDSSSDEELALARRKIKEDKLLEKKKGDKFVIAGGDNLDMSEDGSDSGDSSAGSGCSEGHERVKEAKIDGKTILDEELKNKKWIVGMRFKGSDVFKDVINRYAILSGYPVVWRKGDKRRREAICSDESCYRRIYASWDSDYEAFTVRGVNDEHKCIRRDFKKF